MCMLCAYLPAGDPSAREIATVFHAEIVVSTNDAPAPAHPRYSVTVSDTVGSFGAYLAPIRDSALVAARNWLSDINGLGSIEIQINIAQTSSNTANGQAGTSNFVSSRLVEGRTVNLWEPGALTEIRSGVDRNGTAPDIIINVDPDRINEAFGSYWFDPNPFDADHRVPANLSDGVNLIEHEIGHGLGFQGWRDWRTGAFSGVVSPYDTFVIFVGGNPFFNGPKAVAAYGGLVPLTPGNLMHYGATAEGPGLTGGIMNGVQTPVGRERRLSQLDFAILEDLGYTIGSIGPDIYRFFNTASNSHFYTSDLAERDSIIARLPGLRYEGPAFEAAFPGGGDLTVFRFLNTTNGSHFYTANAAEKALIERTLPGYRFEGVAYGAYANDGGGEHEALFRFFRPDNGTHFYTSSVAERDNVLATLPAYRFEGVAYHIDLL
jgi:hypothetical protein